MRLAQVSTVVATVALGISVALYLRVVRLEDLLSSRAEPKGGMEAPVAKGDGERTLIDAGHGSRAAERGSRAYASAEDAGTATEPNREPSSLEERIAKLEREQKTLRAGHGMPRVSDRFAGNMDDLATQLSLTSTQRTRIEDAVARGRQRIEDILKIPDETGKSPFERRAEARKKMEEAMKNPEPGGVLAFATDLMSSRSRKIPGRNETYAEAINRVRKETRDEISSALDATQRETFEQTNIDGLMGETGQVSFAYAVGDAGAGESAGMVIEMGSSVAIEEEASKPPSGGK